MKKHYETHVEDTDKLISVAGPVLDYKSWYEQYRKLMEEQAQRKYGLYTPTSEGDDENWNEVDLLYGDGNKGPSGVNIGGQGSSDFCHMLFKNMALYMNKVFSKDECIKAYNYLQTLKAK